MPFKKGNKEAAKKGKHEKTKEWEALGEAIITRHSERFNEILESLDQDKFSDKFLQVLEYFKPKLQRTEMKHEGGIDLNLSGLSDEDIEKLSDIQTKISDSL